jgi:hypothetical protein
MNDWIYRSLLALLAANILIGVYAVVTYKAPPTHCLSGIVMVLDKTKGMYVQQGLFPTYCMPIDKD